jgi:hypothetical protein
MAAIGFGMLWAGYAVSMWGYTLIRGYNVTFGQLVNPVHPYGTGKGQPWPPPLIPKGQLLPGKTSAPPVAAAVATA